MEISQSQKIEFLKELQLFYGFKEEQIGQIAQHLEEFHLPAEDLLFSQGDNGDNFFIIYQGTVRVWRVDNRQERELAILENGDSFGEEALLYHRRRSASITSVEESAFLYFNEDNFHWLISKFPEIKLRLEAIAESHEEARSFRFDWLSEGEVVYLISHRHPAWFWFNLLKPAAVLLLSIAVYLFAAFAPTPATSTFGYLGSTLLLLATIIWGVWIYVDWRNDYFIITNQRVVWLEMVILQRATRQETPLSAIQSVNVQTSLIARLFNFGNVVVRTFTGSLMLTDVSNPSHMMSLIEELVMRVRRKSQAAKQENIRHSIRKSLGFASEQEPEVEAKASISQHQNTEEDGETLLGFLNTRDVDGDTFTYHKHWYALLSSLWIYLVAVLSISGLMVYCLYRSIITNFTSYPSVETNLILGLLGLSVPVLIMIYHYLDWRNDIYQVTKDSITDTEKKPFGTEISKSAPLKNVLSLKHKRVGIIGLILNIGEVQINVGDSTLDFVGVHNPALVQQDIFYNMEALKMSEEKIETEIERDRMVEWIQTYHEESQRTGENTSEVSNNSG